jgi:hypothetical protein
MIASYNRRRLVWIRPSTEETHAARPSHNKRVPCDSKSVYAGVITVRREVEVDATRLRLKPWSVYR